MVIRCFFCCLIVCVVMIFGMLYLKLIIIGINVFLFKLKNFMIWFIIIVIWVMYFEFLSSEMKKNRIKICGININMLFMFVMMLFIIKLWINGVVLVVFRRELVFLLSVLLKKLFSLLERGMLI